MYYLNRICETQLQLLASGAPVNMPTLGMLEHGRDQMEREYLPGR
jgi:hypothetical protein